MSVVFSVSAENTAWVLGENSSNDDPNPRGLRWLSSVRLPGSQGLSPRPSCLAESRWLGDDLKLPFAGPSFQILKHWATFPTPAEVPETARNTKIHRPLVG